MHAGAHPCLEKDLEAVGEGEKGVGGGDRARGPLAGPRHGEAARIDPVDLPHPDSHRGARVGQKNRVGLCRAHRAPCERQISQSRLVGGLSGNQAPLRGVVAFGVDPVAFLNERSPGYRPNVARNVGRLDPKDPQILLG